MPGTSCRQCGTSAPDTSKFCSACGTLLASADAGQTPQSSSGPPRIEIITLTPDKGGVVIFKGELLAASASLKNDPLQVTLYRSEAGKYILHEERMDAKNGAGRSDIHVFETAYALHEHCARQQGRMKLLEAEIIDGAARKDTRIACLVLGR